MKDIGYRLDDMEKGLDALQKLCDEFAKSLDSRIRAGIDKFVSEEKAKHDIPEPEPAVELPIPKVESEPAPDSESTAPIVTEDEHGPA